MRSLRKFRVNLFRRTPPKSSIVCGDTLVCVCFPPHSLSNPSRTYSPTLRRLGASGESLEFHHHRCRCYRLRFFTKCRVIIACCRVVLTFTRHSYPERVAHWSYGGQTSFPQLSQRRDATIFSETISLRRRQGQSLCSCGVQLCGHRS